MPTLFKARFLVPMVAALMLAGCSKSADRLAEGPSSENPSDSDPVYTASVPKHKRYASADDDETITSRPLGGTKNYKNSNGYTYNNSGYKAPAYKTQRVPQAVQNDEPEAYGSGGRVTVGDGMTLYSIARANTVTVAELAAANRLKAPYAVHAGQVLRIPGGADGVTPAPRIASSKRASGGTHKVASGDTLFALGRKYGVSPYAIADLNGLSHDHALQLGQRVKIPSNGKIAVAAKTQTRVEPEVVVEEEPMVDEAPEKVASNGSEPAEEMPDEQPVAEAPAEEPSIGMRWPVRGKIISSYGSKPNGLKNEGINIAVPEGASVRAAKAVWWPMLATS